MSGPPLPPPPGAPAWSDAAVPVEPAPASIADRPAWRQGRPGWTLLHIAIAAAIAFAAFFVAAIVGMVGRTQADIDNASDGMFGAGMLVLLATAFVGWTCFAYLDWPTGRRWAVLAGCVGIGVVVAAVLFAAATR